MTEIDLHKSALRDVIEYELDWQRQAHKKEIQEKKKEILKKDKILIEQDRKLLEQDKKLLEQDIKLLSLNEENYRLKSLLIENDIDF